MSDMLAVTGDLGNQGWQMALILLATLRLALPCFGLDPLNWPLSQKMAQVWGEERVVRFHRMGAGICFGYVILFAPGLLFS